VHFRLMVLMRNALTHDVLGVPPGELSREIRRVIEINPDTDPRYEAFVAGHPDAFVYHHPAWLQVLERENRARPVCLAYEDSAGRLSGVLALLPTRGLPFGGQLTGRRLSSLPRTPVAGPLASDAEAAAALILAAKERIADRRDIQLQIKMASDELNGLVDGVAGGRWRPYYVVELPDRVEDLRFGSSRRHARIRATVNKATRLHLRVREADSERDLRAWYELYLETMRWHALPPRPYRFFQAAWELLRPRGFLRLLLAELHEKHDVRLFAGSIFLLFGSTFFYAFNGTSRQNSSLSANDVIQWRAIHDACRQGFRYYDLGEVPEGHHGLAEFKGKWGSRRKCFYRYYYPAPRKFESGAVSTNRTTQLMISIWRKLPLKATTVMGDWIYRYL
jgi:hypothetical protein